MLAECFREYQREVQKCNGLSPVPQHFCLPHHYTDDMKVSVLRECNTDTERKRKETYFKLGILDPQRINIDELYYINTLVQFILVEHWCLYFSVRSDDCIISVIIWG